MFKFLKRVSTSLFPRPDRPWNSDATSNAPQIQIGKKRRYDEDEEDDDRESMNSRSAHSTPGTPGTPQKEPAYGSVTKKQRVEMDVDEPVHATEEILAATASGEDAVADPEAETQQLSSGNAAPAPVAPEEEAVKEVTEGVREVEISSATQPPHATEVEPLEPVEAVSTSEPKSTVIVLAEAAAEIPLPESPVLEASVAAATAGEDEPTDLLPSTTEQTEGAETIPEENAHKVIDLTEDDQPIAV